MIFSNIPDLAEAINLELGDFCRVFQYFRKKTLRKGRVPNSNILFKVQDAERDWVINPGGGTEIQFQLSCNGSNIKYGLGFNTHYVQFSNEKPMSEYVRPYVNSFLKQKEKIRELVDKGFNYIDCEQSDLESLKDNSYMLFGKVVEATNNDDQTYIISDTSLSSIVEDIKGPLFEMYQIVLKEINENQMRETVIMDFENILKVKGQIVLQGPPGTGKTYSAKDLAEKIIFGEISGNKREQAVRLKESDQFEIIQFHPSYAYEDFIRGVTSTVEDGVLSYTSVNRVFADFILKAQANHAIASMNFEEQNERQLAEKSLQKFAAHVNDEIELNNCYILNDNVALYEVKDDAFRYKGYTWKNNGFLLQFNVLLEAYLANIQNREEFDELPIMRNGDRRTYYLATLNKWRAFIQDNSFSVNSKIGQVEFQVTRPFIFVIDEINRANLPSVLGELIYALEYRGETVQSMYAIDGDAGITIPPNLFIIGTMNTADRSVGHIDYAIRRRFAFVDILPDEEVIPKGRARDLFNKVAKLFKDEKGNRSHYLAPDFNPEQVQIGHSYFLSGSDKELEMKLKHEVLPILEEYIRDGVLLESAAEELREIERSV